MENVNVFPQVYKHRVNAAGECTIVIAVSLDRKVIGTDKLHQKVLLSDWNEEKKLTRSNSLLNALIKKRIADLQNEFTRAQLLGININPAYIKKILAGDHNKVSVIDYATELINRKKLKDGRPYDPDTKRRYTNEIDRLKLYQADLQFKDLTTDFLIKYRTWMQNEHRKKDGKPLHKNSIWKALSFLRMVCNDAIDEGYMHKDNYPFKGFDIGSFETDMDKIKYLDLQQVLAIERVLNESAQFLDPLAVRIGWRFLTMCVFGMRISDAMRLDEAFVNDTGHLEFKPHKTRHSGNIAHIPIVSPRQQKYLQKTLELPIPGKNPKSFRTTFNDHLKTLAAMAKISLNLTSHVGRHTMGSFMVDADINEKAAMAILGVKSNNTIKIYSHLKQSKLLSEANKLKDIL